MAFLDWPLSDGSINPDRWLQERDAFAEHSHRLSAVVLGIIAMGLALLYFRYEGRSMVRKLAVALPFLILFQGILGGFRVLLDPLNESLSTPVVARSFAVLHAVGAQGILICLVLLVLVSSPFWFRRAPDLGLAANDASPLLAGTSGFGRLVWFLLLTTIVLGAVVRHSHAGLAIPWFPQASHSGGWIPTIWTYGITVHFLHRTVGIVAAVLALAFLLKHWETICLSSTGKWVGTLFILATMGQIALGVLIIETLRGVWITTFHMLNGALLFSTFTVVVALVRNVPETASVPTGVEVARE